MPLTLSHPAAAIPIRRLLGRFGSLPALILGSMAPDFPYYLPVTFHRSVTHSLASVLWFSVPAGFAAFLVFDRVLKAPLRFLLPGPLRRRIPPSPPMPLGATPCLAVAASAAAGGLTHVLWDSFTHIDGWAVVRLPQLKAVVAHVAGSDFPVFKLLQLGCSVAGAVLMLFWVWQWARRTPAAAPEPAAPFPESTRAVVVVACLAVGLLAGFLIGTSRVPDPMTTSRALQSFLRHTVVASVAAAVSFLLAFALAWRTRARQPQA